MQEQKNHDCLCHQEHPSCFPPATPLGLSGPLGHNENIIRKIDLVLVFYKQEWLESRAEQDLVRTLMFSNCPLEGGITLSSFQLLIQPLSKPSFTNFPDDKNHTRCLLKIFSCGKPDSEDPGVCIVFF